MFASSPPSPPRHRPDIITLVAVDSADVPAPRGLPRINCEGDPAGTPFVSNLFVAAEDAAIASGATFAGFSNGDIAYDDSLMYGHFVLDRLASSRPISPLQAAGCVPIAPKEGVRPS